MEYRPSACRIPTGGCQKPYHDAADVNGGGPHGERNARLDVNNGAMDGFIAQASNAKKGCGVDVDNPECSNSAEPDVMGYHTAAEIPNYWTYAKDFVLDDHMFEPVKSWSLPDHLYLVSGWSAKCSSPAPSSCQNEIQGPYTPAQMQQYVDQAIDTGTADITNAWTDITWLLYNKHVPWAYYVQTGDQPDCDNDSAVTCPPVSQSYLTPGIWNPLPTFEDVQKDHQLRNIQPLEQLLRGGQGGDAPRRHVDHALAGRQRAPTCQRPPGTGLRDRHHQRRDEEPGLGFDRHLLAVGRLGRLLRPRRATPCGPERLRAPRPCAGHLALRQDSGYVDHQTLSSDAYLKFIEDDFLGGSRLNPKTDSRPDPRPDVREDETILGNMANDFDFNQTPRAAGAVADQPTDRFAEHPELLHRHGTLRRLYDGAARRRSSPVSGLWRG